MDYSEDNVKKGISFRN